jgi:hypothetical protein
MVPYGFTSRNRERRILPGFSVAYASGSFVLRSLMAGIVKTMPRSGQADLLVGGIPTAAV